MVFVPGSHHLGILDRNTIDISKHPELEVLIPSLQPGDLVIADIRLWHSSVPNTQATDRVLLQMMFQPADDGAYYPLSVPEPRLIAGQWRTNDFKPWKIITTDTGSQLSMTDNAAMSAVEPPAATTEINIVTNRSKLMAKCKAVLPVFVKQAHSARAFGNQKASNGNGQVARLLR